MASSSRNPEPGPDAPIPAFLAATPPSASSNGSAAAVAGDVLPDTDAIRLGEADLRDPEHLALTEAGAAFRILEEHGPELLLAEIDGDTALPYVLDEPSGTWRSGTGEGTAERGRPGATLLEWGREAADRHATGIRIATASKTLVFEDTAAANDRAAGKAAREAERQGESAPVLRTLPWLLAVVRNREAWGEDTFGVQRAPLDELDANRRYIGAPNGVIDLQKGGRVLPPDVGRAYLITAQLPDPYDPTATHPDVERLTAHLTPEQAAWLWDSLAYTLHGDPARRVPVIVGEKNGGKTTLIENVALSLGSDYAGAVGPGALTPARGGRGANAASPDIAAVMPPRRLAYFPEMESLSIDTARLKALVGGDTQVWRPLYANPRQGRPSATPVLIGNQLPSTRGGWLADAAMRDRLAILEYPRPPDVDPRLKGAWRSDYQGDRHARRRRQALAAKLIRLAAAQSPGVAPPMPPSIAEATRARLDDAHGEAGHALRMLIEPGAAGDRLATAVLWQAVCEQVGADPDDKEARVAGLDRRGVTTLAAAMHEGLGSPRRMRVAGKLAYAWEGWRLRDAPERQFEELT